MKAQIVSKEEARPWCYVCGKLVDKAVVVRLPCPYCTVEVPVRMCLDCAEKLVEELEKAIRDAT